GYHITQPCAECLKACNNGHFWMFLTENVYPVEIKETPLSTTMSLPSHAAELEMDEYNALVCRDA
ncbi:hypothetical protein GGH14_006095, partial [Coemansia sp. RSA 370]